MITGILWLDLLIVLLVLNLNAFGWLLLLLWLKMRIRALDKLDTWVSLDRFAKQLREEYHDE